VLALALALVQGYFVDSHVAKKYDESDFFSKWMTSKTMVTSDQCQSIYQVRERGRSLFFLSSFFFFDLVVRRSTRNISSQSLTLPKP
jgi:hypothetical protein